MAAAAAAAISLPATAAAGVLGGCHTQRARAPSWVRQRSEHGKSVAAAVAVPSRQRAPCSPRQRAAAEGGGGHAEGNGEVNV